MITAIIRTTHLAFTSFWVAVSRQTITIARNTFTECRASTRSVMSWCAVLQSSTNYYTLFCNKYLKQNTPIVKYWEWYHRCTKMCKWHANQTNWTNWFHSLYFKVSSYNCRQINIKPIVRNSVATKSPAGLKMSIHANFWVVFEISTSKVGLTNLVLWFVIRVY